MTLQWLEASSAEKLTPVSSAPSVPPLHYSAPSMVFSILSKFFFFFWLVNPVEKKKKKETKWKDCLGLIHFPPPPAAPPIATAATAAPQLQWQTLCITVPLSCWCFCHKTSMQLKLFWHSCLTLETLLRSSSCSRQSTLTGTALASLGLFFLHSASDPGDCLESSPTLRPATRSRSPSAHSYHLSISNMARYASLP